MLPLLAGSGVQKQLKISLFSLKFRGFSLQTTAFKLSGLVASTKAYKTLLQIEVGGHVDDLIRILAV